MRALKTNIQKPLKWKEVKEIIDEFDSETHQYIDSRIHEPKGGDVFIFYNPNPEKHEDYKVDGYLWKNNGANKPMPTETLTRKSILYKTYYLVLDKEKVLILN